MAALTRDYVYEIKVKDKEFEKKIPSVGKDQLKSIKEELERFFNKK